MCLSTIKLVNVLVCLNMLIEWSIELGLGECNKGDNVLNAIFQKHVTTANILNKLDSDACSHTNFTVYVCHTLFLIISKWHCQFHHRELVCCCCCYHGHFLFSISRPRLALSMPSLLLTAPPKQCREIIN